MSLSLVSKKKKATYSKLMCFILIDLYFSVSQLIFPFLSLLVTVLKILHHQDLQRPDVCCCVQWWMWVMWLSPGTKETVYCPASVCLISASVSLYLWRWNIRIKTPTAVCSTIPSATRPHIWTSLNSVTHVQVANITEQHISSIL